MTSILTAQLVDAILKNSGKLLKITGCLLVSSQCLFMGLGDNIQIISSLGSTCQVPIQMFNT